MKKSNSAPNRCKISSWRWLLWTPNTTDHILSILPDKSEKDMSAMVMPLITMGRSRLALQDWTSQNSLATTSHHGYIEQINSFSIKKQRRIKRSSWPPFISKEKQCSGSSGTREPKKSWHGLCCRKPSVFVLGQLTMKILARLYFGSVRQVLYKNIIPNLSTWQIGLQGGKRKH